jgi:hypothetical protein
LYVEHFYAFETKTKTKNLYISRFRLGP